MNIWIVLDRYDHSETITTAHLTEKGALIKAYHILLEAYDNICDCVSHDCDGFIDEDEDFKEQYPNAYQFVRQNNQNIAEAKKEDLDKHFSDLVCWIGEQTEWRVDVSIDSTRLQA